MSVYLRSFCTEIITVHITVVLAVFAKAAVAAITAVLSDYALFGKLMLTLQ